MYPYQLAYTRAARTPPTALEVGNVGIGDTILSMPGPMGPSGDGRSLPAKPLYATKTYLADCAEQLALFDICCALVKTGKKANNIALFGGRLRYPHVNFPFEK